MHLPDLYQKQISITEWFENIQHSKTKILRNEDNLKRDRLQIIHDITGLPFDKPYQFNAIDLTPPTLQFKKFLQEHQHELCALRLIPKDPALPKLRMRGKTIKDSLTWFKQQDIQPKNYKADFVPHCENTLWSSIFIVNSKCIFGEVIRGGHNQLTQGFHDQEKPISFLFDLKYLQLSTSDNDAEKYIQDIINYITITNQKTQQELTQKVGATFLHNYLQGYFESVYSKEFGTWFIDYNTTIAQMYHDFVPMVSTQSNHIKSLISGQVANSGIVQGKVRLLSTTNQSSSPDLSADEILVCTMTTPDNFLLMQKAAGIITDQGGMLSHAAIVARELGKPCLVATGNATKILQDGDLIELDANQGIVRKLP